MGLETATYISGLTASWPLAGDTKSQGDDHLRLIKSVLQASFPNVSRAFYIPSVEASSANMTLDATDQNNVIGIDATAGDITVTLPSTLGTSDKGFECSIYRSNLTGTNGIVVSPSAGTISSAAGSTATIRIERPFEPTRFVWTGSAWICTKPGAPIGSSMNWDSATIPPGYRAADGSVYSSTTFAELNAALGTTTLRDKRGRVEVALDASNVNMSSASWGGSVTLGSTKANGTVTLGTSNLPAYTPSGTITVTNGAITINGGANYLNGGAGAGVGGGGGFGVSGTNYLSASQATTTASFNGSAQGGSSVPFSIVPPAIATNKLVRVC